MNLKTDFILNFLNGTYDEWVVRPLSQDAAKVGA